MDNIIKTSYEQFPIIFCFGNELVNGEEVTSVLLTCVNAETGANAKSTIVHSESLSSPHLTVVLKNGLDGQIFHLTAIGTTNFNNIFEKDLWLFIDDKPIDLFSLQPGESFVVAIDFINWLDSGETISSRTIKAYNLAGTDISDNIILGSQISGAKIYFEIGNGTNGETYKVHVRIITSAGNKYERILSAYCRIL